MSIIQYGDVMLKLTKVNSFSQEPVYTEDGVDYLYTRFLLDVTGLLTLDDPIVSSATLAANIRAVQENLLSPRSSLLFTINGDTVLHAPAPDYKAGPFPRACTITNITGTRSAVVNFVIEANVSLCDSVGLGPSPENPIISNRWSMAHNYDENFYATRTTTGRLVCRAFDGVSADNFREYAIPPLPIGWKRKRFSFNLASDALTLDYTIEDEEVFLPPPGLATTATGTYREATEKFGTYTIVDVSVTLKGPKNAKKTDLVGIAAGVCLSRLNLGTVAGKDRILRCEIAEELFDSQVTMSISARRVLEVLTADVMVSSNRIGKNISGTEDNRALDLSVRANELTKCAVTAWRPVCAVPMPVGPVTGDGSTQSPGGDIEDPEVYISLGDNFAGASPSYAPGHRDYLFTDYEYEIEYVTEEHKIQLPVAGGDFLGSSTLGATAQIIQLAAPTQKVIIRFDGTRIGDWPTAPRAETLVQNGALLDKSIKLEGARLLPDGQTYEYTIRGEYTYAIETPLDEKQTSLPAPRMPYSLPDSQSAVPPETWRIPLGY